MAASSAPGGESRLALGAGIGCYLIWGFVPLAFQAIHDLGVSSWELLSHRVLWGLPTAAAFVLVAGQGGALARLVRAPRTLAWLTLSALLIAANWAVYIWAVTSGRLLEASLGYYITPLVNMGAGALLFRERIDRIGYAAMALAALGVIVQAAALGQPPLVSLVLALSFGGYGVVRKHVPVGAQTGFLVECLVVALPCLAYVLWLAHHGQSHFGASLSATAWLMAAGPITAIPLMLFAWAARRIPLSAMGFLQFLSPTIGFFIGVAEHEPFTPLRALSFVFIWGGAAVFLWGAWRRTRGVARALAAAAAE